MIPYAGRVTIESPNVVLAAKAAQNFTLALHELAANAAKYGCHRTQPGASTCTLVTRQQHMVGRDAPPLPCGGTILGVPLRRSRASAKFRKALRAGAIPHLLAAGDHRALHRSKA
jgi:hypothetical protein